DLQVAFALSDGNLRVWDMAKGVNWKEADGVYNSTLAWMPGSGKLISSSFEWIKDKKSDGRLREWSYSSESGLKLDGPSTTLPFEGKNSFVPRALAVVASKPVGKIDHVSVAYAVLPPDNKGNVEYRLRLLQSDSLQRSIGFKDFSLWS